MGRTLPTFNQFLEQEIANWAPFRRALRKEDQAAFDRLMALAKRHTAEAAHAARPLPFDSLVVAILLELLKEIDQLERLIRPSCHEDGPKRTDGEQFIQG